MSCCFCHIVQLFVCLLRDYFSPFRYEELLRGERTLHQELQALERKFETWAQAANDPSALTHRSASTQRPLASARDITKDLPPEVAAFEVRCILQGRSVVLSPVVDMCKL